MSPSRKTGDLRHLPINHIEPNDHNPRLVFRSEELQELADSIQDHGVQVPISVYKNRSRYILIDGERRWRACKMINLTTIPAIIYPQPGPVQNIVFMFNIHRFRKDWDPLPTAMKLEELKEIITKEEGKVPTEAELAALTGMSRGAIRRCKIIMEIPKQDRKLILDELGKPESKRRITTDLFVECQRSVRTIGKYLPNLVSIEKPLREALIDKYRRNVIVNVVHMRLISKIARAVTRGVPERAVHAALTSLINEPETNLEDAYARVAWVYDLRSISNQAKSLLSLIESLPSHKGQFDPETKQTLTSLSERIKDLLRRAE